MKVKYPSESISLMFPLYKDKSTVELMITKSIAVLKKLKIKYETLNDLLNEKFNKNIILDKKLKESYVYNLISQLSNSKIFFKEFIEKFEKYNLQSSTKKDLIEKIFIKEIDNEIIISLV